MIECIEKRISKLSRCAKSWPTNMHQSFEHVKDAKIYNLLYGKRFAFYKKKKKIEYPINQKLFR